MALITCTYALVTIGPLRAVVGAARSIAVHMVLAASPTLLVGSRYCVDAAFCLNADIGLYYDHF